MRSERRTGGTPSKLAAGLIFLLATLVGARAQSAGVVINEINFAPGGSNNPVEFIELHNDSASSVDLSGWKFDAGIDYTFPAATTLPANGYVVISADPSAFAAHWGFTPLGPWAGKLSNQGEQVRLRDAADNTVDTVTYGEGFPWPTAARGDGSSMELINASLDNDLGGAWRSSGEPTSGGAPRVYVPENDVSWHYRMGTSEASNPRSAWRALNFVEDGTWNVAQTSIGYGDNDDRTVLTGMTGNYTSLFLRRPFVVSSGAVPSAIKVRARVDDGCIVWINGQEVARFHVDQGLDPRYDSLAQDHETDIATFEQVIVGDAAAILVEGQNIVTVQAFNASVDSSDFSIDVSIVESREDGDTSPTPGAANSVTADNAPPAIRQVNHSPGQPAGGQGVTVTTKVTDPDGVGSVILRYQPVNPGAYIRKFDAAYLTNWTSMAMHDDGTQGDAVPGDAIYTAIIPGSVQTHRRLVRYQIVATDGGNRSIQVPYGDDGSPNFAYFVYDGTPAWAGAFHPGTTPVVTYPGALQDSLPTYQLIANRTDVINCQYDPGHNGQRFSGTLVYNSRIYDHVEFNVRGEESTYSSGKNKWRFHFNTARDLEPLDNWGRPYPETWDELNLEAAASPWCTVHRGMSGVEEALSLRLFELLGLAAPQSHFLHFRVIDDISEAGATQFQGGDPAGVNGGDLWGLYLAVEQPDGSFLDERGLDDGNVYKIESSTGDLKHHADGQPTDGSDWTAFLAASKLPQSESWWRANLDLDAYYNFHAGNRLLGNVDLRPGFNHYFYHAPDDRWKVIPWDLDLMFIPKQHQGGPDFYGEIDQQRALNVTALRIEFQNRARELLDLMASDPSPGGGQIGQLIDEYAQFVAPSGESPNWAGLDAAMWNYNPRTNSDPGDPETNHYGNFFTTPYTDQRFGGSWVRTLDTPDFAGSMKYLTDYATDTFPNGQTWAVNNGDQRGYGARYLAFEAQDNTVPQRPVATYLGSPGFPVNDLRFSPGAYVGTNAYAATQWRIGEISAPGIPLFDPARPRIYEVTDVWRSTELATNSEVTIPSAALDVGHTYRLRVRHKDATGRWSRWSAATQFVAGSAPDVITGNELVISELMYNPPNANSAEVAVGYADEQLFEYIQLMNISDHALDLEGLAFTSGIDFTFPAGPPLNPGGRILVVKSAAAFAFRYGAAGTVAGVYSGNLSNGGERIVLTSLSQSVHDFSYSDGTHPDGTDPWPVSPDGEGPSLVLMNPEFAPDHGLATNWRPSVRIPGSPGQADLIIYAEWTRRYPGLGNPGDDDDGDGWLNEEEYVYGTSPVLAGSGPEPGSADLESLSESAPAGTYLVLTCTHSSESGDVDFFVEFSSDLLTWPEIGVFLDATDNADGTVTERWRSEAPVALEVVKFGRLRAQFQ